MRWSKTILFIRHFAGLFEIMRNSFLKDGVNGLYTVDKMLIAQYWVGAGKSSV